MHTMDRGEAITHLVEVLSDNIQFLLREKYLTEDGANTDQQKDYDALVAIGVTPEEITEAQQRL